MSPMNEPALPFPHRLKAHLAIYKCDVLGVQADGVWTRTGKPYAHILPREQIALNFLPALREEIASHVRERSIRLHRDAHHLNSSQVMCINLMFPVLKSAQARQAVLELLGISHTVEAGVGEFEAVPVRAEGTNFDFLMPCSHGGRTLWEFKLSESDFGAAVDDDAHRAKLRDHYTPRLQALVEARMLQPEAFFPRYQLLRTLSHLESDADTLVIVVPDAHRKLWRIAESFVLELRSDVRARVRLIGMERLASHLQTAVAGQAVLEGHLSEFRRKYALPQPSL
jgi:hypothetical protein